MEIIIHYQGISESPWMKEYFETKLGTLQRYLPVVSIIYVDLFSDGSLYLSILFVRTTRHEYSFQHTGHDLFEAFTCCFEDALRRLRADHQMMLRRAHRKLFGPEGIDEELVS